MAYPDRIPVPEAIRSLDSLDPADPGSPALAAQILRLTVPPPVRAAYERYIERLTPYTPAAALMDAEEPDLPAGASPTSRFLERRLVNNLGTAEEPVVIDDGVRQDVYSTLHHAHDTDGACIKNRFGARCEP